MRLRYQVREDAQRYMAENDGVGEDELFRSMAKRGRQANISFFAFTATPKHKTLAVFGNSGKPAHRYTMRQVIEEGFILDVLKHYTTYATYFRLLKASDDDPNVVRKKAALARFLKLHPHIIAQKTEVMVEHFHAATQHKVGGRANVKTPSLGPSTGARSGRPTQMWARPLIAAPALDCMNSPSSART
ncbi:MAG: hypothetical protein J7498_08920 [Sphingobium sp.]|nr:hypothetical protein [Sphingobium sp.]